MSINGYVATLCIRRAEMTGLKELPGGTKDRITPVLLLAPWLATSPLSKAIEKFEEAFPNRSYFVDIDRYYRPGENGNEAKEQWARLSASPPDLIEWQSLLMPHPNANPCIIMDGVGLDLALYQIAWARDNNRLFCVRVNLASDCNSRPPSWLPELIGHLASDGAADYSVVLEFGLVENPLSMGIAASSYINGTLSMLPAEIPICVSCTSFPSDFTSIDGLEVLGFNNRELISQIQRATNRSIIYGDWGSTKPRSYGHASTPKQRIDYPADDGWVVARGQVTPMTFNQAARRIVASDFWSGNLGVWGEQLIEGAASGEAFSIDSMPKMYSARINIHLHRQAFYGQLPPPQMLDEAWQDDL